MQTGIKFIHHLEEIFLKKFVMHELFLMFTELSEYI